MNELFDPITAATKLSALLHAGASNEVVWSSLDLSMQRLFGHTLFTVLAFDPVQKVLMRIYSSRPDVSPTGGAKRVGDTAWSRTVLINGEFFNGSKKEDLQSAFSEYQNLWNNGCESVLNIPVRVSGITVGTINLLGSENQYDGVPLDIALIFAQLVSGRLEASAGLVSLRPTPNEQLDTV